MSTSERIPSPAPPRNVTDSPRVIYARRLADRRAAADRLQRWDGWISDLRLVIFVLGGIVGWLSLWAGRIGWGWLAVPALAFGSLVLVHDLVARRWRRALRATAFYERGLARLDGRWAGSGASGTRYLDESHPYAPDLDIFGSGSLFELLCTARTRAGEDTLAAWLARPASPADVRARQDAVDELRPRLDLREDLALLGDDVRAGIDVRTMSGWASSPPLLTSKVAEFVAHLLGTLGLVTLGSWALGWTSHQPFVLVAMLELAYSLCYGGRVRRVAASVDRAGHDLAILAALLARIEREPFQTDVTRDLRARLDSQGAPASRRIAWLGRLILWLEMRQNSMFAPFGFVMLWTTRLTFAIERWRSAHGPSIPRWLAAVGEFEALCALASFSYEHPGDPFPELVAETTPWLDGEALGHPLLPEERSVRNDVVLGGNAPHMLLVSGSNMSGKSTLLRTLGVNIVLAQAGATVRARRLRLSPLMPGATLRVQDSLQAGKSRFYVEIARLRQLIDLAAVTPPLLFLLDEVLHGTNSHDRRIGAEAVVRKLLELGAIGLVTTHDLALTEIADALNARVANVHFEDRFEDGQMTFDYRMRPGIVGHSNALALMRSVGIDV